MSCLSLGSHALIHEILIKFSARVFRVKAAKRIWFFTNLSSNHTLIERCQMHKFVFEREGKVLLILARPRLDESRLALRPMQSSIQWVKWAFSSSVKRPGPEARHLCSAYSMNKCRYFSTFLFA